MLTSVKNPKVARGRPAQEARLPRGGPPLPGRGRPGRRARPSTAGRPRDPLRVDELDPLAVQARRVGRRRPPGERGRDGQAHVDGDAAGARRGVAPFLDVGLEALPAEGCVARPARGPRPGQRRHGAAIGRRRGRRRRGVHRDLGRRLQPEDGPGVRGLAVPPAGRPRRRDRRRDRAPARPRASASSRWPPTATRTSTTTTCAGPVAFVFGNEAHGLPAGGASRPADARGARAARRAGPSR